MSKLKDTESALAAFEEAAIKHSEATEKGDHKTANKSYTVIAKAIAFLKEHNETNKLEQFLNHPSDGVKSWSATYLLPLQEKNATAVLEDIAKGQGIRSLAAETALREWRKGKLKL